MKCYSEKKIIKSYKKNEFSETCFGRINFSITKVRRKKKLIGMQ